MKRQTPNSYPNLLKWRNSLGLNQREAAALLGISQTRYCRLERGLHSPRGPLLKKLLVKTGVPLEVLAGVA